MSLKGHQTEAKPGKKLKSKTKLKSELELKTEVKKVM